MTRSVRWITPLLAAGTVLAGVLAAPAAAGPTGGGAGGTNGATGGNGSGGGGGTAPSPGVSGVTSCQNVGRATKCVGIGHSRIVTTPPSGIFQGPIPALING